MSEDLVVAAQLGELVGRTLTPEGAATWWEMPDGSLAWRTPRDALFAGDAREVLRAAWGLADPGAV